MGYSQKSRPTQPYETEAPTIGIRVVDYDPLDYKAWAVNHVHKRQARRQQGIVLLVALFVFIVCGFGSTLMVREQFSNDEVVYQVVAGENTYQNTPLSPIFTDEVQFWAQDIQRWATEYNLDPNLIATVMQIESCGYALAGSNAGAQGLFQVMPFHFTEGEQMLDINTNAKRGLTYLSQGLIKAEGHVGSALAGYNGGHGVIDWGYARWTDETRRYYYWGIGIYQDAVAGKTESERLQEWLDAGGVYLCRDAAFYQASLQATQSS
jgi:hypothetical protein